MCTGHPALLGLQPVLEEASQGLDNLNVSAYIDDIAATGPLSRSLSSPSALALAPLLLAFLSLFPSPLFWSADQHAPDAVREWAALCHIPLLYSAIPPSVPWLV